MKYAPIDSQHPENMLISLHSKLQVHTMHFCDTFIQYVHILIMQSVT